MGQRGRGSRLDSAQPTAGTQGNMSRNSGPEGPGFWQLDGALFKRFHISASKYASPSTSADLAGNCYYAPDSKEIVHGARGDTADKCKPATPWR